MPTKPWYQSKTIWTGILTGLMGIYNTIAPGLGWPHVPEWITGVLGTATIYTRATSTTNISS